MRCDLVMTCINSIYFHVLFAFQENFIVLFCHSWLQNPCQDHCKRELVQWLEARGAKRGIYKKGSNAYEPVQGQGLIT